MVVTSWIEKEHNKTLLPLHKYGFKKLQLCLRLCEHSKWHPESKTSNSSGQLCKPKDRTKGI